MKKKIVLLCLIFQVCFTYSCQSVKDAVQGKKRSKSADEFLVQKKNPLIMPPEYNELPIPGKDIPNLNNKEVNKDGIKKILNLDDNNQKKLNDNKEKDLEKSILKKINGN